MRHNEPIELTESQRETAGNETGFLRIVTFQNAVYCDGQVREPEMVMNIVLLMLQRQDFAALIKGAVKLHKKAKDHPLAIVALKMMLGGCKAESETCDCPGCKLRRELERKQNEN